MDGLVARITSRTAALPHPLHQLVQPERLRARRRRAARAGRRARGSGPGSRSTRSTTATVGRLLHDAEQRRRRAADRGRWRRAAPPSGCRTPRTAARAPPRRRAPRRAARLFGRLLEQMKGEALGRLPADPGQPGQLGDQLVDGAHRSERRRNGSEGTFRISACSSSAARRCASATAASTRSPRNSASCSCEDGRVDHDRADRAAAVGRDPHHAAARRGLDGPTGQLGLQLLQPALHLLAELKELLKICHAIR